MGISEKKMKIVIDNYFKAECNINTSIKDAFEKGFRIGVIKGQSVQPGQTNCEYCHEDSDGYVKPVEKNCHAFIRFGMDGWELSLKANGWHGSAKIRYCPMCGRKLKNDK